MKTRIRSTLGTISVVLLAACAPEPRDDGAPEVLSLARSELVVGEYRAWARAAEARGGSVLSMALHFARGYSDAPTDATGHVELDLSTGRVSVEVVGLGAEPRVDVWLVDNLEGPGASTLPDDHDRMLRVGGLEARDGQARGSFELDPAVLAELDVDRVVVARPGDDPRGRTLLFGGPGAFDRMYRRAAAGRVDDVEQELASLVRLGAELFERETFDGNGRTCTTCHPAANNLTIDSSFIASLPPHDPLFVAERVPALAGLENDVLLRERGLILENVDGFERAGVLRAVPHTFGLSASVRGPEIPFDNTFNPELGILPPAERTGWSGDGAPGSGSLRDFALGAVVQHFPLSLERVPGRDFRVPTDEELDALEVFQLALGRESDPDLEALRFRSPVVALGAEIFLRTDTAQGTLPAGKCVLCHADGGANIEPEFFSNVLGAPVSGNANFGTGVNGLGALPGELLDPEVPRDGGFGRVPHDGTLCQPPLGGFGTVTPEGGALPPGLCEEDFNTPPLIEAADTAPFFHNNAVESLEAAVAFYNDDAFNGSAGGSLLASLDSGGIGIRLDTSEVSAVAELLRVLNTLENIRLAEDMGRLALRSPTPAARRLLRQIETELEDAIGVLEEGTGHLASVEELATARRLTEEAGRGGARRQKDLIRKVLAALERARDGLVVTPTPPA